MSEKIEPTDAVADFAKAARRMGYANGVAPAVVLRVSPLFLAQAPAILEGQDLASFGPLQMVFDARLDVAAQVEDAEGTVLLCIERPERFGR